MQRRYETTEEWVNKRMPSIIVCGMIAVALIFTIIFWRGNSPTIPEGHVGVMYVSGKNDNVKLLKPGHHDFAGPVHIVRIGENTTVFNKQFHLSTLGDAAEYLTTFKWTQHNVVGKTANALLETFGDDPVLATVTLNYTITEDALARMVRDSKTGDFETEVIAPLIEDVCKKTAEKVEHETKGGIIKRTWAWATNAESSEKDNEKLMAIGSDDIGQKVAMRLKTRYGLNVTHISINDIRRVSRDEARGAELARSVRVELVDEPTVMDTIGTGLKIFFVIILLLMFFFFFGDFFILFA